MNKYLPAIFVLAMLSIGGMVLSYRSYRNLADLKEQLAAKEQALAAVTRNLSAATADLVNLRQIAKPYQEYETRWRGHVDLMGSPADVSQRIGRFADEAGLVLPGQLASIADVKVGLYSAKMTELKQQANGELPRAMLWLRSCEEAFPGARSSMVEIVPSGGQVNFAYHMVLYSAPALQ